MTLTNEDLNNRFTYHKPNEKTIMTHQLIRNFGLELANELNNLLPDGREKSLAITKLEEVVMWANASLARNS